MARIVAPADPEALRVRCERGFRQRYGGEATAYASAPGRANLIGEHTDYNDGFVLPFAIRRRCGVAVRARGDRRVRAASAAAGAAAPVEFDLDAAFVPAQDSSLRWADYVRGVVAECRAEGLDPGGFDLWIDSDVPVGAGLSSSAALEVAVAGAVEGLCGRRVDPLVKARLCRRAEQHYAGVPCGIMDQMAAALGDEAGSDEATHAPALLLIDCRSQDWRRIRPPDNGARFVVVDSALPHDLGQGEFARRVEQCREAARRLGVASLRDADLSGIEALRRHDDLLYRRALHVVSENLRTLAAVAAVEAGDWPSLGALLDAGHASLRDLFDVSRPEMDELVASLRRDGIGGARVYGARMTGGGFGGCVVALVAAGEASAL